MLERGDDPRGLWFEATLVPEPDNPDDPNAVAVRNESGERVGYLRRSVAKQYQARLAQLGRVTCPARLRGGTARKPNIGVVLDFSGVYERLKEVPRVQGRSVNPSSR
jgi:hypothetical protein